MDILIVLKNFWINFICGLPEPLQSYILHMGLLLALEVTILSLTWLLPWRSVFLQAFAAFIILSIALYVPMGKMLELSEGWLAFVVTISLFAMIFVPNILPFLLTPRFGNQIKVKKILLIIIWGLFLVQILIGR